MGFSLISALDKSLVSSPIVLSIDCFSCGITFIFLLDVTSQGLQLHKLIKSSVLNRKQKVSYLSSSSFPPSVYAAIRRFTLYFLIPSVAVCLCLIPFPALHAPHKPLYNFLLLILLYCFCKSQIQHKQLLS